MKNKSRLLVLAFHKLKVRFDAAMAILSKACAEDLAQLNEYCARFDNAEQNHEAEHMIHLLQNRVDRALDNWDVLVQFSAR